MDKDWRGVGRPQVAMRRMQLPRFLVINAKQPQQQNLQILYNKLDLDKTYAYKQVRLLI